MMNASTSLTFYVPYKIPAVVYSSNRFAYAFIFYLYIVFILYYRVNRRAGGVYQEIVYEAEVFNRLNPEPKAREFNLLNTDAS